MAALITGALFWPCSRWRRSTSKSRRLAGEPDPGARGRENGQPAPFVQPNYFGFFVATATVLCIALLRFARAPGIRLLLV